MSTDKDQDVDNETPVNFMAYGHITKGSFDMASVTDGYTNLTSYIGKVDRETLRRILCNARRKALESK